VDGEPKIDTLSYGGPQHAFPKTPTPFEIGVLLALMAAANIGWLCAIRYLPAFSGYPQSFGAEANWFGQPASSLALYGIPLLLGIYAAKRMLLRRRGVLRAELWYSLMILASLPYIWFFVVIDWYNHFIYRIECWVGYPIAIWAVPTCTFLIDRSASAGPTTHRYLIRSAIEIFVVIPLWLYFWAFFRSSFWAGDGFREPRRRQLRNWLIDPRSTEDTAARPLPSGSTA